MELLFGGVVIINSNTYGESAMSRRKTLEQVKSIIEAEPGYKLHSTEYLDAHQRLTIECSKGHIYEAKYNYFQQGNRCRQCFLDRAKKKPKGGKLKKLSLEDIAIRFPQWKAVKMLSTGQLRLTCEKGHRFKRDNEPGRLDKMCPVCAPSMTSKTIRAKEALFNICMTEGYTQLEDYKGSHVKIDFECPEGHMWNTHPANIIQGRRCLKCSYELYRSGRYNSQWNPELTQIDRVVARKTDQDHQWRLSVYRRDKYTCQNCGHKGRTKEKTINAHHILSYKDHPDLRHEVSNGIVLCEDCHKGFHAGYGYTNFTREDLMEYLKLQIK
jgi:5-methylcytosine-specific restriction endonuclease McrA